MKRIVTSPSFGLEAWLENTRVVLPLRGMDIRAEIFGGFARVEIDQVFVQSNPQPLDCRYVFPLPADAAVHRCEMHVNGRMVLARVEERSEAKRLYNKARREGFRAALATGERENLFTLELGNLQSGDEIVMRFAYFQPLQRLQDQRTLRIPLAPGVRYVPGKSLLRANNGSGTIDDTDKVPDASRISPPRIDGHHPDAASFSVEITVRGGTETTRDISSPSHVLAVRPDEHDVTVSIAAGHAIADRDFVMTWLEPAPIKPLGRTWMDKNGRGVLEVRLPKQETRTATREVYILLDGSGSMRGENWTGACRAVANLIPRLDADTLVWLTLFSTDWRDYAEKPYPAGSLDLGPAGEKLLPLAPFGGTELEPALVHVVEQVRHHSQNRPSAILILTDGAIGNEEDVVATAQTAGCPVHVIGISMSPNDALRAVAEETGGSAVFLSPGDDIPAALERFTPLLREPIVRNVGLPSGWSTADGRSVRDLASGDDLVVAISGPGQIGTLTGQDFHGKPWELQLESSTCEPAGLVWARSRIRHLERRHDDASLALAKEFNILCRDASFVAWDESEKVVIAEKLIEQPALACEPRMMVRACPAPIYENYFEGRVAESNPVSRLLKPATDLSPIEMMRFCVVRARKLGSLLPSGSQFAVDLDLTLEALKNFDLVVLDWEGLVRLLNELIQILDKIAREMPLLSKEAKAVRKQVKECRKKASTNCAPTA